MDLQVVLFLRAHAHPALDAVIGCVTWLGSGFVLGPVVAAAAVHLWRSGRSREALVLAAVGCSTFLLQAGLKELIGRPRPDPALWRAAVSGFAMPSGHALAAASLFPLLARLLGGSSAKAAATLVAGAMVAIVAFSRVYLAVHWPTDVLAGVLIGLAQLRFALGLLALSGPAARGALGRGPA